MSNQQTEQFEESRRDAELEVEYKNAMGLNTQDAGREFYLKAIKERAKKKGYKISGFNNMPKRILKAIYNKSNNLNK